MDYRDWGREDLARRERYPTDAWVDESRAEDNVYSLLEDEGLNPGGPYAPSPESYPTPSRRRGASHDDADRYTPDWASGAEATSEPGEGRHRGRPLTTESWHGDEPTSGSHWESTGTTSTGTTSSWRRSVEGGPGPDGTGDAEVRPLRDPLPGSPPPVGRRRVAEDDDPPAMPGRRRATEGTSPGRRRAIESVPGALDDDSTQAIETGTHRETGRTGRRRAPDDDPVTPERRPRNAGRRRAVDEDLPEEPVRGWSRSGADRDGVPGSGPVGGRGSVGRRAVSGRAGREPALDDRDLPGDVPEEPSGVSRWDRPRSEARPPTALPRWDRPAADDRRWDRPDPSEYADEFPDDDPVNGSATAERSEPVKRSSRSATHGSRRDRSIVVEPDDPEREDDPAEETGDRVEEANGVAGHDRRGRFIEATGWGRSADTTDWKLAAIDDRLYRSPDHGRRARGGDLGRRSRSAAADGGGGWRDRAGADVDRRTRLKAGFDGRDRNPAEDETGIRARPGFEAGRRTRSRLAAEHDRLDAEPGRRSLPGAEPGRRSPRDAGSGRRSRPSAEPERRDPRTGAGQWEPPTSGAGNWGAAPTSGGWGVAPSSGGWTGAPTSSAGSWERPTSGASGWDRSTDTTGTGQWDRFTDTTEWSRAGLSGLLRRDDPQRDDDEDGEDGGGGRPWRDSGETFWPGTRLAGDDPRWMDTPSSAPRSPAVAYSAPPRGRTVTPARTGRVATSARSTSRVESPLRTDRPAYPVRTDRPAYPVRSGLDAPPRWLNTRRIEDDLLDTDTGSPLSAVLYAAAWYAVPVLVFFVWLLTLDGSVPAGCVTDVIGGGCESDRAKAMASLLSATPRFGLALMVSLVIAVLLRWASGTWKSGSVGLAAAVLGGGLSTILISVISGQALG